ncbi:MAG: TonB-dependent receptor [Opitutaceae bacterium]|nr:TonB-dependent receptor [Opitutaceae bacterium]
MPYREFPGLLAGLLAVAFMHVPQGQAQSEALELPNLSFEDLSQIKIVTASKNPLALGDTPAAVHVITGEEMARLGALSFPQALRYAPGVDVGQISTFQWSVSMRGFNGQFANQLLVLMDGRSILNPNNGGVSWYNHDTFLPDLDRIEIVRGSAGSLWGSNATNGVINILTKDASDTLGFAARVGGGNLTPVLVSARQGFKLNRTTFARVYAKYARFSGIPLSVSEADQGEWQRLQGGFRLDHHGDEARFTLQGDVYRTAADTVYPFPITTPPFSSTEYFKTVVHGANVLGKWTADTGADSQIAVRAYYDHFRLRGEANRQTIDIIDLDAQHMLRPFRDHQLTYGFNARGIFSDTPPTRIFTLPKGRRVTDRLFSLFAQDELRFFNDQLALTAGARLEHNDYTGWEHAPNLRLSYRTTSGQLFWVSVNRTVNTPTAYSEGISFDASARPPGVINRLIGNADRSETMKAFEAGFRHRPTRNTYLDVAFFINEYDHLMFIDRANGVQQGNVFLIPWSNGADGRTRGGEVTFGWDLKATWRLMASYSHLESTVSSASVGRGDKGSTPRNKASLTTSIDLPKRLRLDAAFRYVGSLSEPPIPSYSELDVRLAWRPKEFLELEVTGQNLLHSRHIEAPRGLSSIQSTIPRSFYAGVVFRY